MFKHADRAEFRSPAHIFLGLAGVVAVVWLASKLAPLFILQDFSIYWRATKEWLHGANPYDLPPHTQYVSGEFGGLDRLVSTLKVWSPPTFLLAMVPFSISSLEFGKSLYLSLVILTTWGWLALTYRSICDAYALKGVLPTLAGAFLALLIFPWSPTIDMLRWGGMSVLSSMAFLIIAYSSSLSTGAWTVVFILFSLKPHPAALAVLALILIISPKERLQLLGGAGLALLVALTPLLSQTSLIQLYNSLPFDVVNDYRHATDTLSGILLGLGSTTLIATIVSAGCCAVSLVLTKRASRGVADRPRKLALIMLITPLSTYFAPYAWQHDYVICGGFLWASFALFPKGWSAHSIVIVMAILSNMTIVAERGLLSCPGVLSKNLTMMWSLTSLGLLYWISVRTSVDNLQSR